MTIKERIVKQLDGMDEAELAALEEQIERSKGENEIEKQKRIKQQLEALRDIAGIITDPEEVAALEEATQRRSFFGDRTLDIEP